MKCLLRYRNLFTSRDAVWEGHRRTSGKLCTANPQFLRDLILLHIDQRHIFQVGEVLLSRFIGLFYVNVWNIEAEVAALVRHSISNPPGEFVGDALRVSRDFRKTVRYPVRTGSSWIDKTGSKADNDLLSPFEHLAGFGV